MFTRPLMASKGVEFGEMNNLGEAIKDLYNVRNKLMDFTIIEKRTFQDDIYYKVLYKVGNVQINYSMEAYIRRNGIGLDKYEKLDFNFGPSFRG